MVSQMASELNGAVNGERLQRFLEQKVTSEVDYDACSGDCLLYTSESALAALHLAEAG